MGITKLAEGRKIGRLELWNLGRMKSAHFKFLLKKKPILIENHITRQNKLPVQPAYLCRF